MATKEQVEQKLEEILVPAVLRSVTQLNLLRSIEIKENRMKITLSDAALASDVQEWLRNEIQNNLTGLEGVDAVAVDFEQATPKDINKVNKVVAVMSGKGGVGKSLVTALLAIAMRRQGKAVGILDADVTGPSIPKMFGINGRPGGSDNGLLPVTSKSGIEIMSINLLLPNEDDAVIWRGPLVGKSVTQFWEDVLWGKLDYLIVDLPPGTADVPLTVMQSLPLSGVIIAMSPQDLAAMVVRKAVNMANQMSVPVLGLVENMSYFLVPETGNKVEIFGPSRVGEMASRTGAPILGQIPLDPQLATLSDKGEIEKYDSEVFNEFQEAATRVLGT
ncbi:MAG: Mrp/NBP35 family ATP-binding protein [Dehalococcoidia bacterium]